jgi:hypothetical protein
MPSPSETAGEGHSPPPEFHASPGTGKKNRSLGVDLGRVGDGPVLDAPSSERKRDIGRRSEVPHTTETPHERREATDVHAKAAPVPKAGEAEKQRAHLQEGADELAHEIVHVQTMLGPDDVVDARQIDILAEQVENLQDYLSALTAKDAEHAKFLQTVAHDVAKLQADVTLLAEQGRPVT